MTTATGPADRLLDAREELTPMLRQYLDLTETYPDSLVLFRVGDFYKTFCAAAEETARVCELTLVQREDSTGTYPMAGIPVDNAATYIERLLDAGYRVAVADQVEDPEEATGLVDRAVTRIVTPGTVVDDELLTAGTANYVACVTAGGQVADDASAPGDGTATDGGAAATQTTLPSGAGDVPYAVAAVDVSTGECLVTSATDRARLLEELERVGPAEVLAGPNVSLDLAALDLDATPTEHDPAIFERDAAETRLSAYASRPSAVVVNDAELRACGAVLAYAEYTQGGDRLEYVSRITRYDPRDYLRLDATALRSLELFESRRPNDGATLQSVLDDTSCALGRRKLAAWLRRPLVDEHAIDARLDAVEELTDDALARDALRDRLRDVYDLERLIGRVARGRANARDLRSLATTLSAVPDLRAELDGASSERLRELRAELDPLADVRDLIDRAIQPDPPVEVTEGGVIREGYDDDLDDLRRTEREGREWVADLEASERERTGIDSLDVGYNQVHGYYIEVTNANLDRVPDDYTRRQTLKNAERFYTPELKRREDEILGAAERADSLAYELFTEVRDAVAAETDRVQSLAEAVAELDVLATLASVAVEHDYVRPEVGADGVEIRGGRHPVVEQAQDFFVPNDATLVDEQIAVITGPNMSGKSTYMRQVALVAVLAQMGAFVPADSARLPAFDRVFTRVGASDDIAGGQSTFMREMRELTDILHHATEDSLVLLDEVGRGTSTTDGLAIARATTEFVDDEVGAYTLFATHYHELTRIADERENVFNLHFTATRDGDDVTFLHAVEHGASSSSYGVEVARMAGVPDRVVDRAHDLVDDQPDESPATPGDDHTDDGGADGASREPAGGRDDRAESVVERLRAIDLARTTPLEALNTLYELQTELESGSDSTGR